jgi:hypothetical protein
VKKIKVKFVRAFDSLSPIPLEAKYIGSERMQEGFSTSQPKLPGKSQIVDSRFLYHYYEVEMEIEVSEYEYIEMKNTGFINEKN